MIPELANFFRGVVFTGYVVIGLFFCRYWSRTRDRLFAWFAAAFWLLALERLFMVVARVSDERYALIHLIRLTAFLMIIAAIANKNRGSRPSPGGERGSRGPGPPPAAA